MRQNKYDNEAFFNKYAQMLRSREGLAGAGEWLTLKKMLPDFAGKTVLDLGCGYGWHCVYAAEQGAAEVVGVDISERMLAVAGAKTKQQNVCYIRTAMEDAEFPAGSFDIVLSSLAVHYIEDLHALFRRVNGFLKEGGAFVFSAEHPVYTACANADFIRSASGDPLCYPVDNYFYEGKRNCVFLGEPVVKYHRTLTSYFRALTESGFAVRDIAEPMPPEGMRGLEEMRNEMRRPMMILFSSVKVRDAQ